MEVLGRALRLWQSWQAQVLQELPQATSTEDEGLAHPPMRHPAKAGWFRLTRVHRPPCTAGPGSSLGDTRGRGPRAQRKALGQRPERTVKAAAPLRWTKLELSVTASRGALTSPFGDAPDVSALFAGGGADDSRSPAFAPPGRVHVSAPLARSNFSHEVSGSCEVRRRGPRGDRVTRGGKEPPRERGR